MDVGHWAAFLAIREAAGSRAHLLAAHWLEHGYCSDVPPQLAVVTDLHRRQADRQMAALLRLGLHLVPITELPPCFAQARPMPLALFVRGALQPLTQRPATAIVGARKARPRGCAWAHDLASSLASKGHVVVSGGAMGVDAAAHEGALAAGGATIVYMGTAIDRAYPHHNLPLFMRVLEANGALVSEHPPFAKTFKSSHAMRNRLIAAHAQELVVVEAAVASGTLGAVRFARQMNKKIYVSPKIVGGERCGLDMIVAKQWGEPWPSAPNVLLP